VHKREEERRKKKEEVESVSKLVDMDGKSEIGLDC